MKIDFGSEFHEFHISVIGMKSCGGILDFLVGRRQPTSHSKFPWINSFFGKKRLKLPSPNKIPSNTKCSYTHQKKGKNCEIKKNSEEIPKTYLVFLNYNKCSNCKTSMLMLNPVHTLISRYPVTIVWLLRKHRIIRLIVE